MQAEITEQQAEDKAGPAQKQDIDWVLDHLHGLIDELDFYNEQFREFEKSRMNKLFLEALFKRDPHHILILRKGEERAGFMISSPENGVVFLHWSYIIPQFRKSRLATVGNNSFVDYFNNKQFHKTATYTRTDNRAAKLVLKRHGWSEIAELKNQMFGQDYLLLEIEMNKTIPGYEPHVTPNRIGQAINLLKKLTFGRRN